MCEQKQAHYSNLFSKLDFGEMLLGLLLVVNKKGVDICVYVLRNEFLPPTVSLFWPTPVTDHPP